MIDSDRKILLLDCDEVMGDFVGAILLIVSEMLGRPVAKTEINLWDIKASLGLTDRQSDAMWAAAKRPGFVTQLQPIEGAEDGLVLLRKNFDVRVVTSPLDSPTWSNEREHWLMTRLGFHKDNIVQTSGKDVVFGHAFVDDRYDTLVKWHAAWSRYGSYAIRMVAPWNEHERWRGHDVRNWPELVAKVEGLLL